MMIDVTSNIENMLITLMCCVVFLVMDRIVKASTGKSLTVWIAKATRGLKDAREEISELKEQLGDTFGVAPRADDNALLPLP